MACIAQQHIDASQLRKIVGGSTRAHHALVRAVVELCVLSRVPAVPIATSGIPVAVPGGTFKLVTNDAQVGFSDVVACLPPSGRMVLLEVKTGKARRTAAQRALQDRFRGAGAITLEIRDVAEVQAMLARYGLLRGR